MKSEYLQIRISPELKKVLEKEAAKLGMNVSEFIRFLIQKNLAYALKDLQRSTDSP